MSSYQQISIDFQSSHDAAEGVLCLAVFKGKELSEEAKLWDDKTSGLLSKAMASGTFEGKKAQTLVVTAPADLPLSHFVLLGVGEKGKLSDKDMESLGGHLTKTLHSLHALSASVHMNSVFDKAQSLAQ